MERQLVEFLPVVSSSLRSGFGMVQGIETAARQLGPPLAEELAALQANVKSGSNDAGEILRHLEGIADRQREVEAILATFRLPSRNGDGPKADQPSWNEATL